MCGIIGYTGKKNATQVLVKGLSRLEYRGYDSAGVAVIRDQELVIRKKKGKLSVLRDDLKKDPIQGKTGIGHTRWATHGVPNDVNAHPHYDHKEKIAIVHNGIIENYLDLKKMLERKGYKFVSETDSEAIAHLISSNYKGDLRKAVQDSAKQMEGSYSIAAVHKGEPGRIVGMRNDSPLIIGIGEGENFIASDIPAVLDYTKKVVYLDNKEIVDLNEKTVLVYGPNGRKKKKKEVEIKWDISQAEKNGFRHFMLKEIFEQPEVIKNILEERIEKENVKFDELKITKNQLKKTKKIAIVACGTAYHAGLTAQYAIEEVAKVPVWVDTSSEFRYRDPLVDKETLVIVVSQSGETADTLAALREAREKGAKVLAICNVLGSSIAREADGVIYTHAGPEIAVASTKAYTAQLVVLYLFAYYLASARGSKKNSGFIKEIKSLPAAAKKLLDQYSSKRNKIAKYASEFHEYYLARNNKSCFLYLGRNVNYPNAIEGALKLKEISYISAEGYPAGEMKHGPIALIDENPWVVCIAVKGATYEKMLSNIQEIKARGGIIIAIATEGDAKLKKSKVEYVIETPRIKELFSPAIVVIPLQLLAYYVAAEFGYDIDQPRNLAKSVTVE
ncbi:MAG: glutamine--fructose-6-phosphate transaminase (isomerizing) [Candidatus Aadella gelida]|nr:glutamine--fructose-6-phosphate transaminase (isomerizing) [Candidatus Aadella gelida]